MKLHLPIALLAAVLSTVAYGGQPYKYTYNASEDGTVTSTVIGDATGADFYKVPNGVTKYTTGSIVNVPYTHTGWTASNTVLNIGDGSTHTEIGMVFGAGVKGTKVLGDKIINIREGASVDEVYAGYFAFDNYNNYPSYPAYAKDEADDNKLGASNADSQIVLNVEGKVGAIWGHYINGQGIINLKGASMNESITINILGGQVGDIHGGGNNGIVDNNVSIFVENAGGRIASTGSIYAGGMTQNDTYKSKVKSTHVTINSGTIGGNIFGGGEYNPHPQYDKGTNGRSEVEENTLVEINGGIVGGNVYGGGEADIIGRDTHVVLRGGEITGDVYGSGADQDVTVKVKEDVYYYEAASKVVGNVKVTIADEGTKVGGIIYATSEKATVGGDRILAFDNYTANTGADGYAPVKWVKDDGTQQYQKFNALEVSNGKVNLGTISSEYEQLTIKNGSAKSDKLVVDEKFAIIGNGRDKSEYIITGTGVKEDEALIINGDVTVENTSLTINVKRNENGAKVGDAQLAIGYDGAGKQTTGSMTVINSKVDVSEASTLHMVYNKGNDAKLVIKDGSEFIGGSNNAWLGGGTVEVSNRSSMQVCTTSDNHYNYRTILGWDGNDLDMKVTDKSSFTSAATQFITNYMSGESAENTSDVNIVVSDGSTFEHKGQTDSTNGAYKIGSTGEWVNKDIKVAEKLVVNGKEVIQYVVKNVYCDKGTEGYVGSQPGQTSTITYLCDSGTDEFGVKKAEVNHVKTTISAQNGSTVKFGSDLTYIGAARDLGKEYTDKLATFKVGEDSSISFRQMEVYADTKIEFTGVSGEFSATGVNLYEGAVMDIGIMDIEKAGSVSLGDVVVGDGAALKVQGATLVFTEGADITVANGGSLTLDSVAFELVLGDVSDDYSLTEYTGFDVTVMSGLNYLEEAELAFFENLENANLDITIKGLVDGKLVDMNAYGVELVYDQATGKASIKGSASIPEPTTATLSLLALAALAARRRRK